MNVVGVTGSFLVGFKAHSRRGSHAKTVNLPRNLWPKHAQPLIAFSSREFQFSVRDLLANSCLSYGNFLLIFLMRCFNSCIQQDKI